MNTAVKIPTKEKQLEQHSRPKFLLIGDYSNSQDLSKMFKRMKIETQWISTINRPASFHLQNVVGIFIVSPTREFSLLEQLRFIKKRMGISSLPVFVLSERKLSTSAAQTIYRNKATGVFSWNDQLISLVVLSFYQAKKYWSEKKIRKSHARTFESLASLKLQTLAGLTGVELKVNKAFDVKVKGTVFNLAKKRQLIDCLDDLVGINRLDYQKVKTKEFSIDKSKTLARGRKLLESIEDFDHEKIYLKLNGTSLKVSGEIETREQKGRVQRVLEHLRGVDQINNYLLVNNLEKELNSKLADKLENQLESQFESIKDVDISFKEGIAVVEGKVRLSRVKKLIEGYIIQNSNVSGVKNKLKVAPF